MRTIETKYLGPTTHRGSRIKASLGGSMPSKPTITVGWDYSIDAEENHEKACAALALRLDADHIERYGAPGNYAEGVWCGGHTANGMAWIFIQPREAVRIISECS